MVGGPDGVGKNLLGRTVSEPVGCRDLGGVPGPKLGDGQGWYWSDVVCEDKNGSRRCGVLSRCSGR